VAGPESAGAGRTDRIAVSVDSTVCRGPARQRLPRCLRWAR